MKPFSEFVEYYEWKRVASPVGAFGVVLDLGVFSSPPGQRARLEFRPCAMLRHAAHTDGGKILFAHWSHMGAIEI